MWQSSRIAAKVRAGEWLMEQDREVGSLVGNDPLGASDGSAKGAECDPSTVMGQAAGGVEPKHESAIATQEVEGELSACDLNKNGCGR